jgi:hypothetical protein
MSKLTVSVLLGKTLRSIAIDYDQDRIHFVTSEGMRYVMYHLQDCCESVRIKEIHGDLNDLLASPLTLAQETTNMESSIETQDEGWDSWTWTFYCFATVKGYVTIVWFGGSNGFYSESVDFVKLGSGEMEHFRD